MRHTLLGFVLASTTLVAQSAFVPPGTLPDIGTANAFPFNTSDMRYQALIMASDLGSVPGVIWGFALAPSASGNLAYGQVTMKMAHLSSPTLSTDFATNLAAGEITTMDKLNWSWPVAGNVWNQVDMQFPFVYNGVDNVVVEFTVLGRASGVAMRRDATNQRVYQGSYVGQPTGTNGGLTGFKMRLLMGDAGMSSFGRGCSGTGGLVPALVLSGSSQLGQLYNHDLTNAAPLSAAALLVGFDSIDQDLGLFGYPGCRLYVTSLATLFSATDVAGVATAITGVPNSATFTGIKIYSQWGVLDLGAPNGLSASNYARALLGN